MTSIRPAPLLMVGGVVLSWMMVRSAWWLWPVPTAVPQPPLIIAATANATHAAVNTKPGTLTSWLIPAAAAAELQHLPRAPKAIALSTTSAPFAGHTIEVSVATPPIPEHAAPRRSRLILARRPTATDIATATSTIIALPPAAFPQSTPSGSASRWSIAGWLFHRKDGQDAPNLSSGGQLGGSQAGIRVARRLDAAGRWELYGRATASGDKQLSGEGALGVSFQPTASLPIRLSAERRQRLTGLDGRNAFAVFAVGGVSDRVVARDVRIDAYGAAGVVGLHHRDAFAEGWLRAGYRVAQGDAIAIDLGAGSWGAAQPSASRLDIGPSASATWQTGRVRSRLSIDYRHRIRGHAAPDSGLAVTLSSGF